MLKIIKSQDRGHADHGWLKSYHTFSFADYYNPQMMHYGPLRVINEDYIDGGTGFPTHGHQNMEIVTYIIEGSLEHKDSMGNTESIHPGDVQRMTAGTGVRHSEYNHFKDKKTHLLQIWILPNKDGYAPGYEQISFANKLSDGRLTLVVSPDGENGSVKINQDVKILALKATGAGAEIFTTTQQRLIWIQLVSGTLTAGDLKLSAGDAVSANSISEIKISWTENSEFLIFDMANV
jgi:redox-sensitive bicupin YhaK (pirin superfamily)